MVSNQKTHWQIQLSAGDSVAQPGVRAEGAKDIEQSLFSLLSCPIGSDPLRPLFGIDFSYIDAPENVAIPKAIRAAQQAIDRWMPRLIVDRIEPTRIDAGRWLLKVVWRVKNNILKELQGATSVPVEVSNVAA